ncbi:MAG: hypothetical protein LBE79_05030 [Tannerella sp.]|jgi:hypothetical protein|nr:hypothetical protein [Tannerella sp.]
MTELILKNRIDRKKLNSIVIFLKSWGIDAEIKTISSRKKNNKEDPFSQSFGMWADRDIDIKKIRQKAYERRTKSYDNGTL